MEVWLNILCDLSSCVSKEIVLCLAVGFDEI